MNAIRLIPRSFLRFAILTLLPLLVAGLTALPAAAAENGTDGQPAAPGARVRSTESDQQIRNGQTYYSPDVAASMNPLAAEVEKRMRETLPGDLLPESLKPEPADSSKIDDRTSSRYGTRGEGTGGWTPFARAYTPSGNPDIDYNVWPGDGIADDAGNLHFLYAKTTRTDISLPPDAAGFQIRDLQETMYTTYSNGAWSAPISVMPRSGRQEGFPVFLECDTDGYLHLVYTRWTWGRDTSKPAGDVTAYIHTNENLYYRYMNPEGAWSAPIALSNFNGAWGTQGGRFALVNGRIYGVWLEALNKQVAPSEFTVRIVYVEGFRDDWSILDTIDQWDYSMEPGQKTPIMPPVLAVSPQSGDVTAVYSSMVTAAAPFTTSTTAHAAIKPSGGAWPAFSAVTPAGANTFWLLPFVYYGRNSAEPGLLGFGGIMQTDATHQPQVNWYLFKHGSTGWVSTNATRLAATHAADVLDIEIDELDRWHFLVVDNRLAWDAGTATWVEQGDALQYTRETGAGWSAYQAIESYHAGTFVAQAEMDIDPDGNVNVIYEKHATTPDMVGATAVRVYGADNTAGAFAPVKLSADSGQKVDWVYIRSDARGGALAGWAEYRFSATGRPLAAAFYSRSWNGSAWSALDNVTEVPGGDIIHSVLGGGGYAAISYEVLSISTGDYGILFETAKYDPATGTYYGFKKYYAESMNGSWTAPQLISSLSMTGDPFAHDDVNGRVMSVFSVEDSTTGKQVPYASMQPEPTPPATTYFFAEGTTREGFEEWLTLQNPGADAAQVKITYMLGTGENREQDIPVPAHTRVTVNVNAFVGPGQDVSARVESNRLIVAERPMYFNYNGWTGGHDAVGATTPARELFFAEGNTRGGFAEYLTIQNPSETDATVEITYMFGDGATRVMQQPVGHRSRATVNVNSAVGPETDVSIKLVSPDAGIVAERPMYFDYFGLTGGHVAMGSANLAGTWFFAEGTTNPGFDTFLCLQNPNSTAGTATISYILGDGSTQTQTVNLAPTSRSTVKVNDAVGAGKDVSMKVESTTVILAERPMYFDYNGWTGGHDAVGARNTRNAWYFAEGNTRSGFSEWLSIQNPGPVNGNATLSYILEDGSVVEKQVAVNAHTRVTVPVFSQVDPGHDVSVVVWGSQGLIVERPMYFDYHGWTGGSDVMGL